MYTYNSDLVIELHNDRSDNATCSSTSTRPGFNVPGRRVSQVTLPDWVTRKDFSSSPSSTSSVNRLIEQTFDPTALFLIK